MNRIIVLDKLAREGLERLERVEGVSHDVRTGLGGDALREALLEYDGAICRSEAKLTAEVLRGNRRLRGVVRAGVGTDNIDRDAATRQGIVVMNTPAGNTLSTAEHTFTLIAALSRNIAPANRSLMEGRWDRGAFTGVQLAGKTLGIIGMGRIGREVAARAQAFAMRVIGFDPFLSPEQAAKLGVEYVNDVRDLLPEVDYLTVHTPLTPETHHLVSNEEVDLLKPGARLVNCARGGIYDEEALIRGLESGQLAGVALDVYEEEPCVDSPLFNMPGVLCTPHLGASTEEAQAGVAVEAVDLLVSFLVTGEVRHAVNAVAIDSNTLQTLGGYLDVAYRLGILLSQWHSGGPRACRLTYRGKVVDENTRDLPGRRYGFRQQHAPVDPPGRTPHGGVPGRQPPGVQPQRRARHHRRHRGYFRTVQGQYRPDGRRKAGGYARRQGGGRIEPGRRPAPGIHRRDPAASGHQQRAVHPAACARGTASVDARMSQTARGAERGAADSKSGGAATERGPATGTADSKSGGAIRGAVSSKSGGATTGAAGGTFEDKQRFKGIQSLFSLTWMARTMTWKARTRKARTYGPSHF